MDTRPDMATECVVSAGIQTARSGGTTHKPCWVVNVITPSDANRSWSSGCECLGITCASWSSADTLAISATPRPFAAASMLWHLCDICCHNSESKKSTQVLFLVAEINIRRQTCWLQGKWSGSFRARTTIERAPSTKVSLDLISLASINLR